MGVTVSGAGMGTSAAFAGASLTIKNTGNTASKMQSTQRQTSKTKKNLNYNSREISSQILRASKSRSASMVLARAKSKVSSLQRCLGTGQYNDNEVRIAIAHANRMVKCAKMKVANLKEEERLKKQYENEHKTKERQQKNEVKRRVNQKERDIKTKTVLSEVQQTQKEKAMRQEILRKKRIHRNAEQGKISEADLKYLEEQRNGRGSTCANTGGVSLELSIQAAELSDLQLSEHALELLENQIEQEVSLEMGNIDVSTTVMGMDMSGASSTAGSVSASVDVSV